MKLKTKCNLRKLCFAEFQAVQNKTVRKLKINLVFFIPKPNSLPPTKNRFLTFYGICQNILKRRSPFKSIIDRGDGVYAAA